MTIFRLDTWLPQLGSLSTPEQSFLYNVSDSLDNLPHCDSKFHLLIHLHPHDCCPVLFHSAHYHNYCVSNHFCWSGTSLADHGKANGNKVDSDYAKEKHKNIYIIWRQRRTMLQRPEVEEMKHWSATNRSTHIIRNWQNQAIYLQITILNNDTFEFITVKE